MLDHALRLGFRVEFEPLANHEGLLLPGQVIVVDCGLPGWRQREVIAHELGHAHYGHAAGAMHEIEELELQADLYAARILISPTEYAFAESLCEHPGAIAKHLGVSRRLVELWRDWAKTRAIA